MKFRIFTSVVLTLFSSISLFAQFEGKLDMKMTRGSDEDRKETMYMMSVKNNLLAATIKSNDPAAENGRFILRGDKQVIWIIDDARRTILEMSLKDEEKAIDRKSLMKNKKRAIAPTLTKTGKSESILGYKCDQWTTEEDDEIVSIWGTTKLGNIYNGLMKSFRQLGQGAEDGMDGWEGELARMKVFPLKVVHTRDGVVTEAQEVTKIEAMSVSGSTFEAPAGYTKQSLNEEMGKAMKQMQEDMQKQNLDMDSMGNSEDVQRMLQQMQEQMMKMQQGSQEDSSDEDDRSSLQ